MPSVIVPILVAQQEWHRQRERAALYGGYGRQCTSSVATSRSDGSSRPCRREAADGGLIQVLAVLVAGVTVVLGGFDLIMCVAANRWALGLCALPLFASAAWLLYVAFSRRFK